MTTFVLILAVAAWLHFTGAPRWLRQLARLIRRPRTGAGASAAARARQLRTPTVRVADQLGIPTQRSREAARWEAGAAGERRTAERLAVLESEGWTVLHDRALPRTRANLDHLAVSPNGVVIVPDTKRWSGRWPVTIANGGLWHGDREVTDRLNGVRHEATRVSEVLGVRAIPVVLLDGPLTPDGPLRLDGVRIVPAADACTHLRAIARSYPGRRDPSVAARAARAFPPYAQGHR